MNVNFVASKCFLTTSKHSGKIITNMSEFGVIEKVKRKHHSTEEARSKVGERKF